MFSVIVLGGPCVQCHGAGGALCSVSWCWGGPVFSVIVLGGPCVQCHGAGCVTADPYCLRSPGQEVQQSVAQSGVEPQLDQFMNELLRDDCFEC